MSGSTRQNAQPKVIHTKLPRTRHSIANSLPLLGLGLSGLLDWLQRREILHQEPVSENVTTADLAQKGAFSRIIQKPDVVPGRIVIAAQQEAQNVMLKIGVTAVL